MSAKIEARRFSGKQGTWPAYEMACNAVFAAAKIKKYLCKKEDRPSGEGELEKWKDAQRIAQHLQKCQNARLAISGHSCSGEATPRSTGHCWNPYRTLTTSGQVFEVYFEGLDENDMSVLSKRRADRLRVRSRRLLEALGRPLAAHLVDLV